MSKNKLSDLHKENIRKGMEIYWNSHRKQCLQKNGYLTLTIKGKKYYVHRLVMENYLGRKLDKNEQVHHINGDKTDNRVENLELVLKGEHQRKHAFERKFGKDRIGKSPINKTKHNIITKIKKLKQQGMCTKDISATLNLSCTTIIKYLKEEI